MPLTDLEQQILAFEHLRWRYPGQKEAVIRERFNMSLTRYTQVVNGLIDRPDALAHDPQLVRRLQRLRDARRLERSHKPTP